MIGRPSSRLRAASSSGSRCLLGLPLAFLIGVLMFLFGFVRTSAAWSRPRSILVAVSVGSQADVILMFIFTIVFNIVQASCSRSCTARR
jgi:predicted PurR-regulated permease PerM